jgi:hypothetical protein
MGVAWRGVYLLSRVSHFFCFFLFFLLFSVFVSRCFLRWPGPPVRYVPFLSCVLFVFSLCCRVMLPVRAAEHVV